MCISTLAVATSSLLWEKFSIYLQCNIIDCLLVFGVITELKRQCLCREMLDGIRGVRVVDSVIGKTLLKVVNGTYTHTHLIAAATPPTTSSFYNDGKHNSDCAHEIMILLHIRLVQINFLDGKRSTAIDYWRQETEFIENY